MRTCRPTVPAARGWPPVCLVVLLGVLGGAAAWAGAPRVRVMTFNASMFGSADGQVAGFLSGPGWQKGRQIAEVVQFVAPDILLVNELDYDPAGAAADGFRTHYLAVSQNGRPPAEFPYYYAVPSNTGVASGFDLDHNGTTDTTPGDESYGNDSFGFGHYPGHYSMAVYSKFPIDTANVRTFQQFLWKDMPGNVIPEGYYSPAELDVVRLSSKNHVDLPVMVGGHPLHILVSHPTPPTFDGAEDRNGRRNHDEIRLWADYVTQGMGAYLYDDNGGQGGLRRPARFVVLGDQNADPDEGDSFGDAIGQLLASPAADASFTPAGSFSGDDTASFGFGRVRIDYVVPSRDGLHIGGGAVVWPAAGEPLAHLIGEDRSSPTDHRPVYLDLTLVPLVAEAVRGLSISRKGPTLTLRWKTRENTAYAVARAPAPGPDAAWTTDPTIAVETDPETGLATATDQLDADRKYYRIEAWFE